MNNTLPKVATEYLWFETPEPRALIRITDDLERLLFKTQIQEGFCLVSAMHITSAIWVNDDERGLHHDLLQWLDEVAPPREDYRHHQTGEDNADAHLKRTVLHHQAILPITKGQLDLGPWEQVFYAEFDGQRRKRVIVKFFGI